MVLKIYFGIGLAKMTNSTYCFKCQDELSENVKVPDLELKPVWDRYVIVNSSPGDFRDYEKGITKPLEGSRLCNQVKKSFLREESGKHSPDVDAFLKEPLKNIFEIAKALIPDVTYNEMSDGKPSWYRCEARVPVSDALSLFPQREFSKYLYELFSAYKSHKIYLLAKREIEIFEENLLLYKSDNFSTFGHVAFPAVENLLRVFVFHRAKVVVPEEALSKIIDSTENNAGKFLSLNDLVGKAWSKELANKNIEIVDRVKIISFLMTNSNTEITGLNFRNDMAHGLIRRSLDRHEALAFMLAWLIAFDLLALSFEIERKNNE